MEALNRYGLNNPVKYNDPTGHYSVLGDFFSGFVLEAASNLLWFDRPYQEIVGARSTESSASLAGRVVADVASIVLGAEGMVAGGGLAVGGTGLSCVGTACALAPVAIAGGAAIGIEGAGLGVSGAINLGSNIALLSKKKSEGGSRWKTGDPIDKPTSNGDPSWSTVRRRYWQNAAENALDGEYSSENIDRMKQGFPPLDDEFGVPMELHHLNGRGIPNANNPNNLIPVWPWEHGAIDPFRHYNGPGPQ